MSHDLRLPPHQVETRKFPVVGEKLPPGGSLDVATWSLDLDGLIERPRRLGWDDYRALPREEREVDLHCVTGWSRLGSRLGGIPLASLLRPAGITAGARFVRFVAYSDRDHDTSLPLDVALADTWLVDAVDGVPLAPEHGGPLRTVTPSRYFYKSLKWVRRIELLADDRLGYWERESSYHNVGDPWAGDQRFSTGSIDPAELARLRAGADLGPWRRPRKVVLSADLRDWNPVDRNLRGVQLKSCDLRGARLAAADLRGVNFSLSDLRGADLAGADLRDSDLEGADLSGAELSGADLSGCALSATRFVSRDDAGNRLAARVVGVKAERVGGLLEEQERFLRDAGVALSPAAD